MNDNYRILFVDDEPNLLDGLRRTLRGRYFADFAIGPFEALELLEQHDYHVVVSDMRMPDMDGPSLLSIVTQRWPEIVQMILSGQADLMTTVDAVNRGKIFRFMVKPIDRDGLCEALDTAIDQVMLRRAERELLEHTLGGAVDVVLTLLSVVRPESGRRINLVQTYLGRLATATGVGDDWRLRMAGRLAGVGEVTLPDELLGRSPEQAELGELQRAMIRRHPIVGGELIGRIPRLQDVADIVRSQFGSEEPERADLADHMRMLRLAVDVATRVDAGSDEATALRLAADSGHHPADLIAALEPGSGAPRAGATTLDELKPGMVLRDDLVTPMGTVIAPAKTPLTPALIERINNFASGVGIVEPVYIEVDDDSPTPT